MMNENKLKNPLPSYDFVGQEIEKKTEHAIKDFMSKKFEDNVNTYFEGIMKDSAKIYEKTFSHYVNRSKDSIHNLQIQFQ